MRETHTYDCQYYHDGSWWSCQINAYDDDDAMARCKRLGMQLDGRHIMTVPGRFAWVAVMICAVRNFFVK